MVFPVLSLAKLSHFSPGQFQISIMSVDGLALRVPGPCITNVFATCRKNFSQWHRSFQRKLRSHWLKFLRHVAITLVIQGPDIGWHSDNKGWIHYINELVQELCNSSALAMGLRLEFTHRYVLAVTNL